MSLMHPDQFELNVVRAERDGLRAQLAEAQEQISEFQQANADIHLWRTGYRRQLAEAQAEIERLKERQDFAPDQWWIKELASVDTTLAPLTHDQYRAVRIAVTAINVLMHENAASQTKNKAMLDGLEPVARALIILKDSFAERGARPVTPEKRALWDLAWSAYETLCKLALPNDTTALNKLLAEVYEECAKECDRLDYWYSARAIRALAKQKGVM